MATNTAGNAGYSPPSHQVPYIGRTLSYLDFPGTANVAVTIGVLPPNAIVTGGGVWVVTGFDDKTGDDFDVGVSGSDDDLFASAIDVNTASVLGTLDDLADANRFSTSARTVTANFTTAPTDDGTAGEVFIWVEYVIQIPRVA